MTNIQNRAIAAALIAFTAQAIGAISVPSGGFTHSQDFNTLPATGTGTTPQSAWTNNSTLAGWYLHAGNNLVADVSAIRVTAGSTSSRSQTSYGTGTSTERAFGSQGGSIHDLSASSTAGSIGDNTTFGTISVGFTNNSGASLNGFSFSYTGEQWVRSSSTGATRDTLTVQWALGSATATPTSLTWSNFTAPQQNTAGVNFTAPQKGTSNAAIDGNAAANRIVGLGASVTGISWTAGQTLFIRWVDINDPSTDGGLAIDDFSFAVPTSNLPGVTLTQPVAAAVIDNPSTIELAANATPQVGATISKVEFYRGSLFLGEDATAPYTGSWATPFNGSHTFTAIAQDDQGRRATSPVVSITVTGKPTVPPVVSITSPADAAVLESPASFTLQATASDIDGVLTRVEFFVNGNKIGESTAVPFQIPIGPLLSGSYTLAATATDDGGATTTASSLITVLNTDNILPTVSLSFPIAGSTVFNTSANLTTIAADSDGIINKVEFFSGATKLGESTSAPFAFTWSSIAPGPYTLTAVATDNDGGMTTSAPVNVTFNDSATYSYAENFNGMGTSTAPPTGWSHIGSLGGSNSSWTNSTGITVSGSPSAASSGTVNNTLSVQSDAANFTSSSNTQAFNAALSASSSDRALATSPTSGGGNILQLSVTNNAAKAITKLDIGYDIRRFRAVSSANELPGYWLFYSLDNGATWTNVSLLNSLLAGTDVNVPNSVGVTMVRNKPIFLNSPWAVGATALFRWVDDNASETSPDQFIGLDNVSLAGSGFLTGISPVASITSPANGASFPSNANISLTANATDSDGTVALVEFFANSQKIGEDNQAPYEFVWVSPAPGAYVITARATDLDNDFFTSAPVNIAVLPPPGIVAGPWTGAVSHQSAVVAVTLTAPEINTRMILSTSADLSSPVFSDTVVSSTALGNSVKIPLTGLQANTTYHYAIEINGVAQTAGDLKGRFTTFPVPGPASYRFAFASCGSYNNASQFVYEGIVNDNPLFFIHMGDMNYQDVNSTDPNDYRSVYTNQITIGQLRRVCRAMGMAYMWDDHDYAGNDSNKNNIGRTATRQVYRERFPHYNLAAGGPDQAIYQAFTVGRVRYILTDLRSERDPISQTDNATKSMMGSVQKAWFKQQLIEARGSEVPFIVWNSSVPFISTSTSGDDWGRFQTERREILEFIRDEKIQNIVIISGDMHALSLDDGAGTASYVAGVRVPVFHGAALAQSGSSKGGPYRVGASTITPDQGLGRYGIMDVTDNGSSLSAVFRGRIASGTDSTWTSTSDWTFTGTQNSFTYNAEPTRPRRALSPTAVAALNAIQLAWQDDSGVETAYRIERRPSGGGSFAAATTLAANVITYSDANITPGATYDYRIVALNQSIESDPSATASATALTAWQNFKIAKLGGPGGNDLDDSGDNDGLALLQEFAFGLNPALRDNLPLVAAVPQGQLVTRGIPTLLEPSVGGDGKFRALYIRYKNTAQAGIAYQSQFSGKLDTWGPGVHAPVVIADDGDYELISERFPDTVNGDEARFFRMMVMPAQP